MQSILWSRLPMELVALIITQTTCQQTQDAWCLATNHSRQLNHVAMKTRWSSVTIDDRDLVPAAGDDRMRYEEIEEKLEELNIGRDWKPTGQMIQALLTPIDDSGRCAANYVRQIIFDFRMLRYWTDEILNLEDPHGLMPSLEAAEYTLDHLQVHIRNLTHITCHGDTPQQLFDFIHKYAATARELLLVRKGIGSYGALQIHWEDEPNRTLYPSRRLPLEMSSLSTLHHLVVLDIHQLSYWEVQAMMTSLPELINLQTLILACDKDEHSTENGCAFDLLFSTKPEKQEETSVIWLPQGLKRLSMMDPYQRLRIFEMPVRQPQQYLTFPDSLEYLKLDLLHYQFITLVLDSIQTANLQFLAVPEHYTRDHENHGRDRLCEFAHLEKLRIMRIWEFKNTQLVDLQSLGGTYSIDDLVLGTRNDAYYRGFVNEWRRELPVPTLSDYLYGFSWSGSKSMTGKWGALMRVRVDHIDIVGDLDISVLSQDLWKGLKLLMLQPAARQFGDTEQYNGKLVDKTICDELVQSIVLCASQSLVVVVLSRQWYWIDKDTRKVWSWAAAKMDALQNSSMIQTLDTKDIDFLHNKDVPYWCERDTLEWHRERASSAATRPYSPSAEMLHQWNYLGLYRAQQERRITETSMYNSFGLSLRLS